MSFGGRAQGIRAAARRRSSTSAPVAHGTPDDFTNTGSANVILVVPPETLIGDLILVGAMDAFSSGSSVAVTGTGFTQVDNATDTAGDLAALVAWKFAVASDVQTGLGGSASSPVSYSFPTGGSHKALGWMEVITGVNATPINAQSTFQLTEPGVTGLTYPNITTTVANTLLFGFMFARNGTSGQTNNSTTAPGGSWTERVDQQTNAAGSNNAVMQVIMMTQASAATVTGPSVTQTNSGKALMKVVALQP